MFNNLTQNDIVKSIELILLENNTQNTEYSIWWNEKLVSAIEVITKVYTLKEIQISTELNLVEVQSKLLDLGFPIVDTVTEDDFFTEKELTSFSKLISRKYYNKDDAVDINIGNFISSVIWKKTKLWRQKLTVKGWFKDNDKFSWQTRSNSNKGNLYKEYTWFKVFPNSCTTQLIFFTVGVGLNGDLEYKLDIQENHNFFTDEYKKWFFQIRDQKGAGLQRISKGNVSNESWESLIEKSNAFFDMHITLFRSIQSHFWPEKRLMRLVWNENEWCSPTKKIYYPAAQSQSTKSHHEKYGFGFEEWLLNPRYHIDGIQYGFIQGVDKMPSSKCYIDELFLYSIDPTSKTKYLVGKLNKVKIYHNENEIKSSVLRIYESFRIYMIEELKEIKSDTKLISKIKLRPNLSFKIEDAIMYDELIAIPNSFLNGERFTALKIQDEIKIFLNEIEIRQNTLKFEFSEGNQTGSDSYSQETIGMQRVVNRTHANITNDLHCYLESNTEYEGYLISTEKSRIGNNLIDCVAIKDNRLLLFEAKTNNSVLKNVRQALGQILEYALLDKNLRIEKLIIVGPAKPTERDMVFLNSLQECVTLPLSYWSYSYEENNILNKFKQYL